MSGADPPGAATVAFLLHPASPLHDTGWKHPEHQGRLRALAASVGRDLLVLHDHVVQMEARDATVDDLLRVHSRAHVDRVHEACRVSEGKGSVIELDADTVVSPATWKAALGSAGAAITAVGAVARGEVRRAFVATRPPGHHATRDAAMGFCLFNNVAVAARRLQAHGSAERVLIVDWDVHHGNGTQDIFYADPSVFYLSLHQSPHYPGTGSADATGVGAGVGTTLNVPVAAGTPRDVYRDRFAEALTAVSARFAPDFVLVSAGFDPLAGDPLGGLLLEPEDFHQLTRRVVDVAGEACDGRVVACLEGGYDPARLGLGVVAVIRALADLPCP